MQEPLFLQYCDTGFSDSSLVAQLWVGNMGTHPVIGGYQLSVQTELT